MKYEFSTNTIHGIGCIATENIKKGDIVGKEPYFIVKSHDTHKELRDYYWKGPNQTHLLINGLGNYCNHGCLWCSTAYWRQDDSNSMDFTKITKWLSEAKKRGLRGVGYVGNGEPLAYKQFSNLIPSAAIRSMFGVLFLFEPYELMAW